MVDESILRTPLQGFHRAYSQDLLMNLGDRRAILEKHIRCDYSRYCL